MATILVATDYTKASRQAVNYAATLTRRNQAKIILFNSFECPKMWIIREGFARMLRSYWTSIRCFSFK